MDYSVTIAAGARPPKPGPMATEQRSSPDVGLVGIYEISKILSAPAPLERTLANVANVLSSFLQMRLAMLVILDGEGDPEIVATAGWAGTAQGKPIETLPQLVIDRIVATETAVVVQDIDLEPLFEPARDLISAGTTGRISFIGVPIKAGDRVVGTLSIDRVWDGATRFRIDDDVRFLTMVANLVGQTVRLHQILAADRQRLLDERRALEKALSQELADRGRLPTPKVGGIVGESNAIKKVMETVSIVAKSNSTVLLRGESGTGKELFARAIHDLSARKSKPFIKVNCAALPETVLESELFGHEKGAFTGALAQRAGRFEMANGGTLFLDEIGEISAAFQAKLLRVLQEGEFERVGGNKTLKVDVRLVCATNKNLEEAVTKGEFRADLYYRINVVPVALPPLRDRPGDIPLLARAFIQRFNKENGRQTQLSQGAVDTLKKCYFPGNVRELENCVRRTATLARGEMISREDLACATGNCLSALLWTGSGSKAPSDPIGELAASRFPSPAPRAAAPVARMPEPVARDMGDGSIQNCEHADEGTCPALGSRLTEKQRLVEAMERSGWVQAKAARLLGLTPRQIGYALKKHGVELKRF